MSESLYEHFGYSTAPETFKELEERIRMDSPKKLTYLACPYSHPDPDVRQRRHEAVNRVAGMLMKKGMLVFSPISHTHPIAVECDMPKGWDFWHAYDRAFIEASERIIVLMLEGWQDSVGVKAEIAIAAELGIPVEYI